jgi:RimJ/RimL family protein N-acetyltransferase
MPAIALRLRPVEPDDEAVLLAIRRDRETQSLLMTHPELRVADDSIEWLGRWRDSPTDFFFSVIVEGRCVGFVQIFNVHRTDRHAQLGIALGREARGRGYGVTALGAALRMAREDLQMRKIVLEVRSDNAGAIRLYTASGFRLVGTLRDHYIERDRSLDVVIFEKDLSASQTTVVA